jgi:UDP-galactopyranose mutase
MYSKIVVVGSGLFGLTIAERIANVLNREVLVFERRSHIGGNAWSEFDSKTGIEIHKYGSHLFHTSHEGVWAYVNQFTGFNKYKHHVWTIHNGRTYPMPINLGTMSQFFDRALTPNSAREVIENEIKNIDFQGEQSFESVAIKSIGTSLYNAFIRGYTEKQWQIPPTKLPAEIFTRLPLRFNFDTGYFNDKYEGLPINGYQDFILNIANHNLIKIMTDTDFFKSGITLSSDVLLIYTGPIDLFFQNKFGRLGWRTLDFRLEHHALNDYQGTSVMNYADTDVKFTRIHEFQHLHPEREKKSDGTVIMREFSRVSEQGDEPYYPINSPADRVALKQYRDDSNSLKHVIFGGRLGTYQYLDMHMAIASALKTFDQEIKPRFE